MVQEYLTDNWHGLIASLLKEASPQAAYMATRIKRRETLHTAWYRDMTALQIEANPTYVTYVAEEVARFVQHACQVALHCDTPAQPLTVEDRFYLAAMEEALTYLGSRVLDPARESVRESGLYVLYTHPREVIEEQTGHSYRDFLEMIDFLVLHKDWEANYGRYHHVPQLIDAGLQYQGGKFQYVTRQLGQMLGSQLYDGYLTGRATKRFLRSLYMRKLHRPGAPRDAYYAVVRKLH
jgi:hypothetical protein